MKKIFLAGVFSLVAVACSDSNTLAKVNGKPISQEQFDAYLEYKRITARTDEQKQKVLDQYLQREAMADLIENNLLNNDPLISAEINELKKEILISRYFDRYLKENVTEEAVANYYNNNLDRYQEKKVHVAHILWRLNRNMDESQRQVKSTTAQEAYSKIQAGLDFAEAADLYSEDGVSAKKGGDLGWLIEGSIHKNFSERAFSLEEGEVSEIFETPYGFHIIKVLEAPKTNRKSFDSVKGQIRYQLRNAARDSERQRLLEKITIEKTINTKTEKKSDP